MWKSIYEYSFLGMHGSFHYAARNRRRSASRNGSRNGRSKSGPRWRPSYARSSTQSIDGRSDTNRSKGRSQSRNRYGYGKNKRASNRNWSMIPPPHINAGSVKLLSEIFQSTTNFQLQGDETFYSYELYSSKNPNAFYVQISNGPKYVAYVADKENLSSDLEQMRKSSPRLIGYIYHSTTVEYDQGSDKKKHGFITFMIPFESKDWQNGGDDHVCSIQVKDLREEAPGMQRYKKYILSTNISIDTIPQKYLETLEKTLKSLTDITIGRNLYRTDDKFCVKGNSTTNLIQKIKISDDKTITTQLILPYGPGNAVYAKTILQKIVRNFFNIIRSRAFQAAMMEKYFSGGDWQKNKEECIKRMWNTTLWILVRNLCREPMNQNRSSFMANIFRSFKETYEKNEALPPKDLWDKYIKDYKEKKLETKTGEEQVTFPSHTASSLHAYTGDILSRSGLDDQQEDIFSIPSESDLNRRNWS